MTQNYRETVVIKWKYNNLVHILSEKFLSEGFDKKFFEISSTRINIGEIHLFDIAKKEYPYALYLDMDHEIWIILQNLLNMNETVKNFKSYIDMLIKDNFTREERKLLPVKCLKSILYDQKKFIFDILKDKKIYCVDEKFSHNNWSRFTSTYFFLFKDFDTIKKFYKKFIYVYNKCTCFEFFDKINILHVYLPFGQELIKTPTYACINPYIEKSCEKYFLMDFDMNSLNFRIHFFDDEKEYFKYLTVYKNVVYSGKMKFFPDRSENFRNKLISSLEKIGWEIMN